MDAVGLDYGRVGRRRRRAFSGGQCQRVSIARALALDPKLLICDEAVSALDVSVQAQILNLLETTKERYRLTLIFVAHDLAVVKRVSDRVAVMYLGRLCEVAPADELYRAPAHHYTAALLEAIPSPTPAPLAESRTGLTGEPPSATEPPSGCRFRTRCPRAEARCVEEVPELRAVASRPPRGVPLPACIRRSGGRRRSCRGRAGRGADGRQRQGLTVPTFR